MKDEIKEKGTIDPSELSANSKPDQVYSEKDFLSILKYEFFTPFLMLVKTYLLACNGNRKTTENLVNDFKRRHPRTIKIIFFMDAVLRVIYLLVIFIVVIRGLGLVEFVKSIF